MLALLGACAAPVAAEPDGASRSPIVRGTPSTKSQDATVYIAIGTQGQFCSGALVAPNLVLTARHCVQGTDENAATECAAYTDRFVPTTLTIALGATANGTTVAATGKQTFVDAGDNMCSHDIALILLDRDVEGAMIAAVRFDAVTKGETTATVGYGDDGSGTPTNGRYQRASLLVDAVGPVTTSYTTKDNKKIPFDVRSGELATGESTCFGDSGGPLFDAQGNIIGVTSRGVDAECNDRPSIYSDTASHGALIKSAATAAGHPLADPVPAANDPAADTTGDTGDETDGNASGGSATKKRASSFVPQSSAGCALARSGAPTPKGGAAIFLSGLAMTLLLSRRRR